MKQITLFSTIPLIACLAGCGVLADGFVGGMFKAGEKKGTFAGTFTAAVWNVQALFDGNETGGEYTEYLEASGWTAEKYRARVTAISRGIAQMIRPAGAAGTMPSGTVLPDLIGLVELENPTVLDDLALYEISKRGYCWTAFAAIPGSSLGIGIISRYPVTDVRSHSITVGKDTAPRPVLEVRIAPNEKPLVFLLCHWKSKLGGDDATEALRRASARVVSRRLYEIKAEEPETPVIVMGDLNENHDEFRRRSGKVLTALLPDEGDAAEVAYNGVPAGRSAGAGNNFLVISGEKPPRADNFHDTVLALYSPWAGELTEGSYYYREEWETIDHFLLSDGLFDNTGWEYADARTANTAPFTGTDGTPSAYIPRYGGGLSDHLPLLLHLRYAQ